MNKLKFFILFVLGTQLAFSQVIIGTDTNSTDPTEDFEVYGNLKLTGELTLENPGNSTVINGQNLLVLESGNTIKKLDLTQAAFGPINYIEYKFTALRSEGLLDFDTKINASNYIVAIQSYGFVAKDYGDPDLNYRPNIYFIDNSWDPANPTNTFDDKINGVVARAWVSGGTWHLQFFAHNSKFYFWRLNNNEGDFAEVDLTLRVLIYRKNLLISDEENGDTATGIDGNGVYNVYMNGSDTKAIPPPNTSYNDAN